MFATKTVNNRMGKLQYEQLHKSLKKKLSKAVW